MLGAGDDRDKVQHSEHWLTCFQWGARLCNEPSSCLYTFPQQPPCPGNMIHEPVTDAANRMSHITRTAAILPGCGDVSSMVLWQYCRVSGSQLRGITRRLETLRHIWSQSGAQHFCQIMWQHFHIIVDIRTEQNIRRQDCGQWVRLWFTLITNGHQRRIIGDK